MFLSLIWSVFQCHIKKIQSRSCVLCVRLHCIISVFSMRYTQQRLKIGLLICVAWYKIKIYPGYIHINDFVTKRMVSKMNYSLDFRSFYKQRNQVLNPLCIHSCTPPIWCSKCFVREDDEFQLDGLDFYSIVSHCLVDM